MASRPTNHRSVAVLVFFIYALFFVPLWVVLPAMNEFIIARRCLALHGVSQGTVCGGADVNASANEWFTWVMLACNVPSVVVALPLGYLSDHRRWGRRPVMLWCCATQLFGSAGMVAVCLFELELVWMVPTYLVNGLGGGSYMLQSVLLSSLADTAPSRAVRSVRLAWATAMCVNRDYERGLGARGLGGGEGFCVWDREGAVGDRETEGRR
jgi:MFS family permease